MSKLSKVEQLRKLITRAAAKQIGKHTNVLGDPRVRNQGDLDLSKSTMNVEGRSGMEPADALGDYAGSPGHFPRKQTTDYAGEQRFNRAHQGLLQEDDGSPIFESMGLMFDRNDRSPNKMGETAGHWVDNKGVTHRNPTTEYRFDKTDDWRQNLAADYAGAVMGQDGVAISDMEAGLPRGMGYASIMNKPGSDIEGTVKKMEAAGRKIDKDFYAAPGSKGDVIGSIGPIEAAEAQWWKKIIGDNADAYNRPGGGDAYRGAEDYKYKSVADNMGRLKTRFMDQGMGDAFDKMLKQTAKQAPEAYGKMRAVDGSVEEPNFGILWDHINSRPDEKPRDVLQQLIDDKIISMDEMSGIMQQFSAQQGLLA